MGETIPKSSTLYYVGVEKTSSNFGVDRLPVAVKNSEFPQESPICDFARRLPKNSGSLYLNMVEIPSLPSKIITEKIDL